MDKNTAYQVISQFRANNCKNGALANALDEALKALKPVATNLMNSTISYRGFTRKKLDVS